MFSKEEDMLFLCYNSFFFSFGYMNDMSSLARIGNGADITGAISSFLYILQSARSLCVHVVYSHLSSRHVLRVIMHNHAHSYHRRAYALFSGLCALFCLDRCSKPMASRALCRSASASSS